MVFVKNSEDAILFSAPVFVSSHFPITGVTRKTHPVQQAVSEGEQAARGNWERAHILKRFVVRARIRGRGGIAIT